MARSKKRVTLQDLKEEFSLGELVGSYRVPGVLSWLELWTIMIFVGLVVSLIRVRLPGAAYAAAAGIAAGFAIINLAWNWLTRGLGIRRYLLYPEGLVKVGWYRPRDWVLWSEVAGTKRTGAPIIGLFPVFYSVSWIELKRADGGAFRISLMGFLPRLPRALETTMKSAVAKQ